jgi:hypothetical protein
MAVRGKRLEVAAIRSCASSIRRKMPPSRERSRDATTTSLLSITEKCSVAEMGYVLIVGSNPESPTSRAEGQTSTPRRVSPRVLRRSGSSRAPCHGEPCCSGIASSSS